MGVLIPIFRGHNLNGNSCNADNLHSVAKFRECWFKDVGEVVREKVKNSR